MQTLPVGTEETFTSPASINAEIERLVGDDEIAVAKSVALLPGVSSDKYPISVQWSKDGKLPFSTKMFVVPIDKAPEYITKISKALATAATSMDCLDLNYGCPDRFVNLFFEEALKEFGKAGHWEERLETLYLVNWNCPPESSFSPSSLRTVPLKLKTLEFFNRSRDCDVRACSVMLNGFAQTSPALKELSVGMANSRSDDWAMGTALLENLPASCPRLRKICIVEGEGDGSVPVTDEEAQNLGDILRPFKSLEDLYHRSFRRRLPQNAVDGILQAVLSLPSIKVICLDSGDAGPDGLNSLINSLKKRVEDITLSFLAVDLPDRDMILLEKEATGKLIGFQEDSVPVPRVREYRDLPGETGIRVVMPPRRRRSEAPVPLITRINNSLRLIRLRRFVEDVNVCPALLPLVFAQQNKQRCRTRLFTMLKAVAGSLSKKADSGARASKKRRHQEIAGGSSNAVGEAGNANLNSERNTTS